MTLLFKFKFIFLATLLSQAAFSNNQFTLKQCLDSTFSVTVSHKSAPFGLLQRIIKIDKDKCNLSISHEDMKVFKNFWSIDVCRGPVHIKHGVTAVEVAKKQNPCNEKSSGEFCKINNKVFKAIQDDGLIFATGEKENLKDDHGRVFCTFLLAREYLQNDRIMSRFDENLSLKEESKKEVEVSISPVAPAVEKPAQQSNVITIEPAGQDSDF